MLVTVSFLNSLFPHDTYGKHLVSQELQERRAACDLIRRKTTYFEHQLLLSSSRKSSQRVLDFRPLKFGYQHFKYRVQRYLIRLIKAHVRVEKHSAILYQKQSPTHEDISWCHPFHFKLKYLQIGKIMPTESPKRKGKLQHQS